jgi:hypothetical protein
MAVTSAMMATTMDGDGLRLRMRRIKSEPPIGWGGRVTRGTGSFLAARPGGESYLSVGARAIVPDTDYPCQGLRPNAWHTVAKFGDTAPRRDGNSSSRGEGRGLPAAVQSERLPAPRVPRGAARGGQLRICPGSGRPRPWRRGRTGRSCASSAATEVAPATGGEGRRRAAPIRRKQQRGRAYAARRRECRDAWKAIAGVRDQGQSFGRKAAAGDARRLDLDFRAGASLPGGTENYGCGGAVLHRDAERLVKRDLFR